MQSGEAGGQSFTPQRFHARSTGGTVGYINRHRRPFSIRNAETGKLLFRPSSFSADEALPKVDEGRMVIFTVRGCRASEEWSLKGVNPFISPTLEQWFDPGEDGAWPVPR